MSPKNHSLSIQPRRELNGAALRLAMLRLVDKRTVSRGDVVLPCIPALAEHYALRLRTSWTALGRPFSETEVAELRRLLTDAMTQGRKLSPFTLVVVNFEGEAPPASRLQYRIQLRPQDDTTLYDAYRGLRTGPLFGSHPDAKVLAVLSSLNGDGMARVLDVGAGTGRNAIEVARRGHQVDALEIVPAMCASLRDAAQAERLALNVIEADFLDPDLTLPSTSYQLAFLSEVVTQLDAEQLRAALERICNALVPGGRLLFNAFLTSDGYRPEGAVREFSLFSLCSIFTRSELKAVVDDLPIDLISDESCFQFERDNLPIEAWPPTSWSEAWSRGSNVFDLPYGASPVELRWLAYGRR